MSEEPAKKRRRDSDDDILRLKVGIAKESKLWFDDGNIVVVAENVPFRVHKGVLAGKSEVFNDMFSLPQPSIQDGSNVNQHFEGTPVVRLTDKWQHVQHVLAGIYHPEKYIQYNTILPFIVVDPWIRLGTKYGIESLRTEALNRLRIAFPASYQAYQENVTFRDQFLANSAKHYITVLNLALSQSLHDILPAALCSLLSCDFLSSRVEKDATSSESLSPTNLATVLVGQRNVLYSDMNFLKRLVVFTPPNSCRAPHHCIEVSRAVLRASWEVLVVCAGRMLPNASTVTQYMTASSFCTHCKKQIEDEVEKHCKETWEFLEKHFGLKP